ncbi:MAG: hypothetical protein KJZ74_15115 [Gemmatimonadales bacterium]|nr:hypothetical protein [Gemmatimonadales bacterium]
MPRLLLLPSVRPSLMLAGTLLASAALASTLGAQPPAARDTEPALTTSPLPTGRVTYRTLVEVNLEMEQLAARHPDRVRRFALPHKTVLGQTVWALEVARNVAVPDGRSAFLMTGLHHSREWPTVDLTMEFVHDILMNDGKDARITALLDNVRFLVVPVVNPDGYELSRSLLNEQKRKSCRITAGAPATFAECANPRNRNAGVDLNRNYGAFWGGIGANLGVMEGSYRGPAPFSEPEIQNMRDLMNAHQVVVALSNHTPDAKVLRAPSSPDEPVPADAALYDALGKAVGADLKWEAGPWTEIYYAASGTMEEYAYYSAGTFAYTFENTPGQRSFHPPYSFVVDQYFGTGAYPGSNARAGFLRLYEAAANAALHSVLEVRAPAGATLTLTKSFTLESAPVLQADSSRTPAIAIPITLTSSLTVPAGRDRVTWHVNPSLRPSQKSSEHLRESWTVTCARNGATQRAQVTVARGERAAVDLSACR